VDAGSSAKGDIGFSIDCVRCTRKTGRWLVCSKKTDHVYVFDNRLIIEEGVYEELISGEGL